MSDYAIIRSQTGGPYHLFDQMCDVPESKREKMRSFCQRERYKQGDEVQLESGDEYHIRDELKSIGYGFCKYCAMELYG